MIELVLGASLLGTLALIDYWALCIALKKDKDFELRAILLIVTAIIWVVFYHLTH